MSKGNGCKKKKPAKKRFSWVARIYIHSGRDNGAIEHKIYFGALGGGDAKKKALPKIQRFLEVVLDKCRGNPKTSVELKSCFRFKKIPVYELKPVYSYAGSILRSKKPSRIFREKK